MKAAFPGSFDPISNGHLNIIERAGAVFDELLVIVAENRLKSCLFTAEERVAMVKEAVKPWKNVSVLLCDRLLTDLLREQNINIIARGVRGAVDFSFECEVSLLYKSQNQAVETFLIPSDPAFSAYRSSYIKEMASFKGDVSAMVPPFVNEALKRKFSTPR